MCPGHAATNRLLMAYSVLFRVHEAASTTVTLRFIAKQIFHWAGDCPLRVAALFSVACVGYHIRHGAGLSQIANYGNWHQTSPCPPEKGYSGPILRDLNTSDSMTTPPEPPHESRTKTSTKPDPIRYYQHEVSAMRNSTYTKMRLSQLTGAR